MTPHRYPDRQSAACVIFVSYLWTHLRCEGSKGLEGSEGGGGGWHRRLCRRVVSPQGKRLTMICASLALLHPLLSLTHWIFRSLMLPYKSSSHSANHVRCASLRSGGRRLAVRIVMEYQIGALPRTPFPVAREFPSRGNERYEEKKQRVIYFRYHFGVFPFGDERSG